MRNVHYLGKLVGYITADKRFLTYRRQEHFFRKYQGFGMSTGLLSQLRQRHIHTIALIYTRKDATQAVYLTDVPTFYEKGITHTDREADTQLILPVKEFTKK